MEKLRESPFGSTKWRAGDDGGLASVWGGVLTAPLLTAETGGSGLHATGHDPGDGPQLQSIQTEQAPDPEGSPHDGEAGEAAEDRAGEEASAEAPGTWARALGAPPLTEMLTKKLGRVRTTEKWTTAGSGDITERIPGAYVVQPHHFIDEET